MANALIEKIEVEELFGQFSYSIPEQGKLNDLSILYGDNGVGKSTILRAVFHMLSPHGNSGHRTALRKIPFSKLIVTIRGGFIFSATRPIGPHSETIEFDSFIDEKHTSRWIYSDQTTQRSSDDISILISQVRHYLSSELTNDSNYNYPNINGSLKQSKTSYLSELKNNAPKVYLVGAEREIQKDDSGDSFREYELSQLFIDSRTKKIEDISKTSRNISLNEALSNANKWINNRAIQSANRGSMNVHSVYEHVLKQLSIDSSPGNDQSNDVQPLINDLEYIENQTRQFAKYELSTKLDMTEFKMSLATCPIESRDIFAKLIEPYVRSLTVRLDALKAIYDIIDLFVSSLNLFFQRKNISYSLSKGFIISNSQNETIDPSMLSSGEQHLLLMFCYILIAREEASVFMIDEPEISLNIKWQRQLIRSLIEIGGHSGTQFIFASHSIELISQHRHSIIKLG